MNQPRNKTVGFTILFIFVGIIIRFFYFQVIRNDFYRRINVAQTLKVTEIIPVRGQIKSRNLIPLAINQKKYKLSLYKPNLKDQSVALNQLKILKLNSDNTLIIDKFFNTPAQLWVDLKGLFDKAQVQQLTDPLFVIKSIDTRYYPYNDITTSITGISNLKDSSIIGINGIENYYQKRLSGKSGFSYHHTDATGKEILMRDSWQNKAINGQDIVTTIDLPLQIQTYQILKSGVEKYQADYGIAIVMQSKTGEILAMSSIESSPSATYKNHAITDLFEPGSIYKPLVMASALDSKSISSNWNCPKCNQPLTINDHTINNWDKQLHPNTNLFDTIKNSDNIAMSQIMISLSLEKYKKYHQLLGFNQKTLIDIQGETKSPVKKEWPYIDFLTASFGQGFAVTPIQFITAFNSLANQGNLTSPRLTNFHRQKITPVFSPNTTELMSQILGYAVKNSPANQFNTHNLDVCAKSGTAQIAIDGKYSDQTEASYVGYFPCNSPKYTILVTLHNPKSSTWGSSTAAPIWFEIALTANTLL